jgi:hypothetical protein
MARRVNVYIADRDELAFSHIEKHLKANKLSVSTWIIRKCRQFHEELTKMEEERSIFQSKDDPEMDFDSNTR